MRTRTHRPRARLLLAICLSFSALVLSGCGGTMMSSKSCGGANFERNCTFSYKSSEGQWSTHLEGDRQHSQAVINGTFTVESGSGTLFVQGSDRVEEFPISADEPVELTDMTFALWGGREEGDDPVLVVGTETDGTLEGFSGEVHYVTS